MELDPTDASATGKRLLLADDSPAERRPMAIVLRDAGYAVEEAPDGQTVLRLLQREKFDLLLLDLQMPVSDGFAVLGYVQRYRPGMPVVLMSGMPPDDIQGAMRRLPRSELPPLLIKPIDAEQLLELVAMQLGGEPPQP